MHDDNNQLNLPVQECGLETITSEGSRYFNAFAYPMAQSVPHIYLSSLPFSPAESAILQYMHNAFQNNVTVEVGRLKQWPAIRQTLAGHTADVISIVFSSDGTRIVRLFGQNGSNLGCRFRCTNRQASARTLSLCPLGCISS